MAIASVHVLKNEIDPDSDDCTWEDVRKSRTHPKAAWKKYLLIPIILIFFAFMYPVKNEERAESQPETILPMLANQSGPKPPSTVKSGCTGICSWDKTGLVGGKVRLIK